jgi:glycerol transport system ATP-binding protein
LPNPKSDDDYALQRVHLDWDDGGAYALLGPSGCGKTTLLNIISGLLTPSEGQLLFDDQEMTSLEPDARNIAQVFQFPVIYDTMTVRENLSFPLRNRGVDEATIATRVAEIATMLELDSMLDKKAAGLTPDNKQKISLGRGLVRDDVNVIMFDEPLTVIDPHLKWKLRSKLKELHQKVKRTMIYVTHDQTEALTFADQVVVMNFGQVLQVGTPIELFERPAHTFVGHFIGSPGMNVVPASVVDGQVQVAGQVIDTASDLTNLRQDSVEVGVRPEFVRFADAGIAGTVETVMDVGRHTVVKVRLEGIEQIINAIVDEGDSIPDGQVHLQFDAAQTRLYEDGWVVAETQG